MVKHGHGGFAHSYKSAVTKAMDQVIHAREHQGGGDGYKVRSSDSAACYLSCDGWALGAVELTILSPMIECWCRPLVAWSSVKPMYAKPRVLHHMVHAIRESKRREAV